MNFRLDGVVRVLERVRLLAELNRGPVGLAEQLLVLRLAPVGPVAHLASWLGVDVLCELTFDLILYTRGDVVRIVGSATQVLGLVALGAQIFSLLV